MTGCARIVHIACTMPTPYDFTEGPSRKLYQLPLEDAEPSGPPAWFGALLAFSVVFWGGVAAYLWWRFA